MGQPQPASTPAVVLGMCPTGLAIIRGLGRKGVPVISIDREPWAIARFSRYARRYRIGFGDDWQESLYHGLVRLSEGLGVRPVLFWAQDQYLLFLSQYGDRLREHFILPDSANADSIGVFVNKERFYRTCQELGVPLPPTYFPKSEDEVAEVARTVSYPCIIKPSLGHLWRHRLRGAKLIQASHAEGLIASYREMAAWDSRLIVQEVVPGGDDQIYVFGGYFNRESRPLCFFTGRKLRQFPPKFGSGCLVESVGQEDIARESVRILGALNFHGICGTEFKLDPRDGKFKMMEINQRPTLWFQVVAASGVELIHVAYLDLTGQPVPPAAPQRNGVKWVYAARDVVTSLRYLASGELSPAAWWRSLAGPRCHAMWAPDDLGVVAGMPLYLFLQLWSHAMSGRQDGR